MMSMNLVTESKSLSDKGRKRKNNEDSVAGFEPTDSREIQQSGNLYIVADGVGGASRGEYASKYAAQKVLYEYYQYPEKPIEERLSLIIQNANRDIYQYAIENGTSRMATTMVAAVIRGNKLTVANVGDSRAYLISSGKIEQISSDHNTTGELIKYKTMTAEEAENSEIKDVLLRSLGGESEVEVDIFSDISIFSGDMILLCSDGLTRYAKKDDLLHLSAEGNPEEICEKLVAFANHSGGQDNITVYIIKIWESGELKLVSQKTLTPEDVDWDSIQTLPDFHNIRKLDIHQKARKPSIIFYGLIAIIAILAISGFLLLKKFGLPGSIPISPTIRIMVDTTTNLPNNPQLSLTSTELIVTSTLSINLGEISSETIPPENIIITNTGTINATPQTPEPSTSEVCIHRIQSGEYIANVFDKYTPKPPINPPFFEYKDCDLTQFFCLGPKQEIPDPNNILPNLLLEIPGVNEQNCNLVPNSYWVIISNP